MNQSMLLQNARIATMEPGQSYGLISRGAIAIKGKNIAWIGAITDIPAQYQSDDTFDLQGRLVTPALIDCHTHIVYGGNRAREFEMRLNGASYEEIARAGGGIISTVTATRDTSETNLLAGALTRLDTLIGEGVSLVEVKSGYGLDIETELKMLRVARKLQSKRAIRIKTSFLGAHAIPAEYTGKADKYIDDVCLPALDTAHEEGLVDAVDGFCEGIAFSAAQIERVFKHAHALGLPVKLHAEQLSNIGGTRLAARYGALSADHVEYASDADAEAMAAAGTVAVLLPGAFYTLQETRLPPIEAFQDHNVAMALATDCNPGSSPMTSILLVMNMACTLFGLTPKEALAGVTRNAAAALGLDDTGVLRAGLRADLAIWDVEHPGELSYRIGYNPLYKRMFGGKI